MMNKKKIDKIFDKWKISLYENIVSIVITIELMMIFQDPEDLIKMILN